MQMANRTAYLHKQALRFFERMFDSADPDHLIAISAFGNGASQHRFIASREFDVGANWVLEQSAGGANVYARLSTIKKLPSAGKRGDDSYTATVPGVWLDVDVGKPGHPTELSTAFQLIRELVPFWPTLIVCSGGGLHPYWLFNKPMEPDEARPLIERWGQSMTARFAYYGFNLDQVFDLPRLMRVPGSHNHKAEVNKPSFIIGDYGHRYNPVDLEPFMQIERNDKPAERVVAISRDLGGASPISRARAYINTMPDAISGSGGHNSTLAVACESFRFGLDEAEIRTLMDEFNERAEPQWTENELQHKIDSARTKVCGVGEFGVRLSEGRPLRAKHRGKRINDDSSSAAHTDEHSADTLPEIRIERGRIPENMDEAIAAIKSAGVEIFDRGGWLMRPVRQCSMTVEGGVTRCPGALVLRPIQKEFLVRKLCEFATWLSYDKREKLWLPANPPTNIMECIIGIPDHGGWPQLRAIACHPVLFPDGRRVSNCGFDSESGLYIDAQGDWPEIPDRPTQADAARARETIEHFFRNFPFASEVDKAVALSMLLTAIMRPALDLAPGHAADATAPGSGKSLYVDAVSIIATGNEASVLEYSRKPEEFTKALDAALIAGDSFISIDNVEAPIEGASLCSTLTQRSRTIRVLGKSKIIVVPCMAAITITGNNIVLKGDIVRRILSFRLNAQCERPELREFRQDLLLEARERRGELVAASHTIVAAYINAGSPDQGLPPFGGFGQWDKTVRRALVWAGAADPLQSVERAYDDNPILEARLSVFTEWRKEFDNEVITSADVVKAASASEGLKSVLAPVCMKGRELDARRLGNWLKRNRDVITGDCVLRRVKRQRQGGHGWRIDIVPSEQDVSQSVACVPSVASVSTPREKNGSNELTNFVNGAEGDATRCHTCNTSSDQDDFEERAAILEFDAGLSRNEAERRARARVHEE